MKKVRVMSSAALVALMSFGAMTMVSCDKTEDCAVGYEGKDCDVEIRKEMIGTYNATDVNNADATDVYTYQPVVSNGASVTIVNISKFGDFFENAEIVTANVTKSNDVISFTIPEQTPPNQTISYKVSGNGTYNVSSKRLDITYSLISPTGSTINYTGTWNKQ
jgi:hypothetical protein